MTVRRRCWTNPATGEEKEAWQVTFVFRHADGRRRRIEKTSPVNTRRGAEEYERQLRDELLRGTDPLNPKATPTLRAFAPTFLTYSDNNNKKSTVASKRQILEDHLLPVFGERTLDQISFADVETLKAALRKKRSGARPQKKAPTVFAVRKRYGSAPRTLSDKSINNILAVLRRMLTLAQEQNLIAAIPRIKLFRVARPAFDFLDFEEAQRLVGAADPEWRCAILIALKTGLRQGELIGLQWSDLDLVRGKLHVRRTIWRGHEGLPKGGRTRIVDLPASAIAALAAERHLKGPFVFCGPEGEPLTPGKMKRPLGRALKRSGISRAEGQIGWHDLRHTYGSHLAMKGVPLKVIQELMGHATIEMTMRYAHLSPEMRHAEVQRLDEPVKPSGDALAMKSQGA